MAFARTVAHATSADGSFSAAGTAAWNGTGAHTPAVVDAVSGGIPYFSSTTAEGTSALLAAGGLVVGGGAGTAPLTYANLTYAETSGPRLTVGSGSGTSTGGIFGYMVSGYAGIWGTNVTPSDTNGVLVWNAAGTDNRINAATGGAISMTIAGVNKVVQGSTAGIGPSITAGTATTDVQALSATQTWNAAGVAFVHEKHVITDTASAAGALAFQYLGGASGTTALASLTKGGKFEAVSYRVNGADGVSFGPSAVASITVVNGIITAIS